MRINELFRVISIFINVYILLGDSNESTSQRTARAIYTKGQAKDWVYSVEKFINLIFHNSFYTIEKSHVKESFTPEMPVDYEPWSWKK